MAKAARASTGVAAIACTAAALTAGACADDETPAGSAPTATTAAVAQPARFAKLPTKWAQTTGGATTVRPSGASTWTLATSWPYTPHPGGPAAALPRGELFVSVLLLRRHAGEHRAADLCRGPPENRSFPRRRRGDPALDHMTRGALEGRTDVTEYRLRRSTTDYWVDLRVAVDGRRPSARARREADRVLRTLQLPDWPNACPP